MIKWFGSIITDNIKYFRQIVVLAKLELDKVHNATDFGWFWAIVKPLMYVMMFYIAISTGFRSAHDIDGTVCPYFIWLAAGIVPWQTLLSDLLTGGANCFSRRKAMISKFAFPKVTYPMIAVLSKLYIHIIMVLILIGMALLTGVKPCIYWLQLPIYMFLAVAFCYIWSFLTGLVYLISADFVELIKAVKPAFFWLSGILFNIRGRKNPFFTFNPISYIVEGYRNVFAYNLWIWQQKRLLMHFCIVMAVLVVVTYILYRKLEKKLAEIM